MKIKNQFIVFLLAIVLMFSLSACNNQAKVEIEPKISQIKTICELAVVDCYYHNVAKFNEKDAEGMLWWKKDKKFWIEYSGKVRIGVDLSLVSISVNGEKVKVTLPEAKVLSSTVDSSSLTNDSYIVDVNSAKISAEDEVKAFEVAQRQLVEHASSDTTLLANARDRVQTLIEDYIKNIGDAVGVEYQIDWNYIGSTQTPITTAPVTDSATESTTGK